jgi:hypothetical protein
MSPAARVDFPLTAYDQTMIAAVLASDESPADKRRLLVMFNCAKAFASDDPALWSQAADLLAYLQQRDQQRDQGILDPTAYAEQTRHAVTACSLDCWLATMHLYRCGFIAWDHVRRRRLARN